ncbi:MAG TPA: hypothetical protein VI685_20225 [Candidatus Angelobacter sp.]
MKLVIKIGWASLEQELTLAKLVRALSQLLLDQHQILLVHGGARALRYSESCPRCDAASLHALPPTQEDLIILSNQIGRRLVAFLGRAGVPAIGICAGDQKSFRLKTFEKCLQFNHGWPEMAPVDPFWFDLISRCGGVPVVSNIAPALDLCYRYLCADQLASACAIGWSADALIFLTAADGIADGNGAVMRWLDAHDIAAFIKSPAVSPAMVVKLVAAQDALNRGVRRVRILPLAQVQSLSAFYFERIDHGTEIFCHASRASGSNGPDIPELKMAFQGE